MLKNLSKSRRFFLLLPVMGVLLLSGLPAGAEVGPKNGDTWKPVLPTKRQARTDDPLVVADVIVDKTAENSVVARDQAMLDAKKAAFQKLAERNMTPDELKNFKMPADKDINVLVQDFEIKNEQMSSVRYVGNFTVRFRDGVKNYMTIHPLPAPGTAVVAPIVSPQQAADAGAAKDAEAPADAPDAAEAANDTAAGQTQVVSTGVNSPTAVTEQDSEPIAQSVLVLPYFEDISGKTLLWEEDNPWLMMWQGALPKAAAGAGRQFSVPLGDISDVATGASSGVWSGDYKAIEKLRSNYGAEEVVLAVANKSADKLSIDLYTFNHGRLRRRATLTPYIGEVPEEVAYKKAMTEVLQYLQQPGSVRKLPAPVVAISRDVTNATRENGYTTPQVVTTRTANGTTTVITQERAPLVTDPATQVTQMQNRQVLTHVVQPLTVDNMQQPYAPQQQTYVQQVPPVRTVGMQPVYSHGTDIAEAPQPAMLPPTTTALPYNSGNSASPYSSAYGAGSTSVAARMQFDNPHSWMDVQRRLSSITPPVRVNITSLNSNSVAFTLSSETPLEVMRQSLSARGVALGAPVTAATGRPVYDVRLAQ